MSKKVQFETLEKSRELDQQDPELCCRITYKGAAVVVVVLEGLYCLYYTMILAFAIFKHRQAWSIILISVNLFLLVFQILLATIGVWKEKHRLLQTHLIFLCLTMVSDLIMTTGFFILAVYPKAKDNALIGYKGAEFNARTFGIVMGSAMILFFIIRFVSTWILWRYWTFLRRREQRRALDAQYHPLPMKA